ncbi:MAG: flavodoxin [Candidatus Omnitrophota bacterium]
MQSIIIYYSYSGNTQKVAGLLTEYLKLQGEVDIIELKGLDESDKFFTQAARAFRHKRAEIQPVNFDLSKYDLICVGTPVWAFGPAPAMNTYLDKCFGLGGKNVILFTTYGSGTGNERCLNYMQDILARKGTKEFQKFSIQQFKVNDKEFILSKIREIARLWPNG